MFPLPVLLRSQRQFRRTSRTRNTHSLVFCRVQRALARHFGKDQHSAGFSLLPSDFFQPIDDSVAGEEHNVDNMSPISYAVQACSVLLLNRASNVNEFAIFKDEEVVLGR